MPKSSDKPLEVINVVEHQTSKLLELQVEEENGNQVKVMNDKVNEGGKAFIDDLEAPQEDWIITQEEDGVQIEDLNVTQEVRMEELRQPTAGPELSEPLEVTILHSDVSDIVSTESPS